MKKKQEKNQLPDSFHKTMWKYQLEINKDLFNDISNLRLKLASLFALIITTLVGLIFAVVYTTALLK